MICVKKLLKLTKTEIFSLFLKKDLQNIIFFDTIIIAFVWDSNMPSAASLKKRTDYVLSDLRIFIGGAYIWQNAKFAEKALLLV